jgi:acetyl-CoA C-acetyltransferase
MIRVHTAGSVGGSTAVVASHLVHAGIHQRVLTVAFEKQSESNTMWALAPKIPFQQALVAGAGGYFAPTIREYIRRTGAPEHIGIKVAVKDRRSALKNPYAHLHQPDIDEEKVRSSMMLWDPIRFEESCPASDGACAMVLSSESAVSGSTPPAWVLGTAVRSEPLGMAGRDEVDPRAGRDCAADVYSQAGISDPSRDADVCEMYVPFSWYEPMWLENLGFAAQGEGWKMVDNDVTALGGDMPIDVSGGVLSSNPIGASGMLRFAEVAMQVRGQAGEHQVDGAKVGVGHAYGGGSQFFAMWVVGSEKP